MPDPRPEQIQHLRQTPLDVLVLGGGINGAGVIRDLALRSRQAGIPLQTGLVEQRHFASGTSGKNSQLIHGGLRYLKYLQFHLVRESLRERSVLLRIAPQYAKPLAFLLPMYGIKSRLMYGAGLGLYDRLAGAHAIAPHRMLGRDEVARIEPELTHDGLTAGAIFYDCGIVSARFVVENVLDAMASGALAANYVRADAWERAPNGLWRVRCTDTLAAEPFDIHTRKLVDARGAWSDGDSLRLVRGSHIVIPRVSAGDHAIAHFERDGRIIFLIPWGSRNQLTLVGTTDEEHHEGPEHVHITASERDYLLGIVRKLFPGRAPAQPISAFSSLRPLIREREGSPTSATREHKIWNSEEGILHIAGGKYTTYRLMSEEASDLVCQEIAPRLACLHVTADALFAPTEREIGDALEQHLSDYLFVSTYLGYERGWDVESLMPYAEALGRKRGWTKDRVREEINAVIEVSE
ncbi:MAG TPA: glycerol-3-phosphate dehydrogenase/oxidase [Bryobacteraceae bacterium]|nr:glycerol-3-phosphate dehydrogenase/oxidase [Bryobacteraceae bacterium]